MKIWKRIAALALTGAMCVSLFGCGKKDGQGDQKKLLSEELGYGYTAAYQDLDTELEYLQSTISAGGKIYIQGYYYDDENYENSGNRLYELDPATGETKNIPMPKLESTDNSSENIQTMTVCPDGSGYWVVTDTYTYSGVEDVPAEMEPGAESEEKPEAEPETEPAEGETPTEEAAADDAPADAEAGLAAGVQVNLLSNTVPAEDAAEPAEDADNAEEAPAEDADGEPAEDPAPIADDMTEGSALEDEIAPISIDNSNQQESYALKKFDMNGELLQEIDLNEAVSDLEWFYCQNMAQGGDGNIYLSINDGKILCFDKDGKRQADIDLDTYFVQSLVTVGSGAVLATYYESEGNGGAVVTRLENGSASEAMHPEGVSVTGGLNIYGGDGDVVLLSDGNLLYYMNAATGEVTKLLSWLDSDINASNISGVAGSEDTLLVVLSSYAHNSGEYTFELGTLTKTPKKDLPQRTILTLGAQYLDDQLRSAVVDFNRKSDTYRVTLVDYGTYNTTEDYTLGAKQMDMDVISGNSPDLISLQGAKTEQYISKGVLANLSELLEKDETISADDLMAGPLQGYTKDGKLYGMPYSFGVQTLYGSAMRLGERNSWTLEEMAEVVEELDDDVQVMTYTTQSSFLSMMLTYNLSRFVDYSKATCSFDSEEFKSLLKTAASLPKDPEEDSGGAVVVESAEAAAYDDEMTQLQRGDTLLSTGYIYSKYEIKNFLNLYVEDNGIVKVGYPTESGSGAVLSLDGGVAISDKCQDKDGAWAFLKTLLEDDFQKNQWSLPVTVSAFDSVMEEAKEPEYYMEKGEKVYVDSTGYIGETEYKLDDITDEQIQEFKDYINGASMVSTTYDSDLMDIVTEEAAAFFAGDKSADEVADLIQSRASIYLGETS